MSRHVTNKENIEVVIGWDNMLQTYFCQIKDHDVEDEEEQTLFWVPNPPERLYEIENLRRATQSWSHAPSPEVFNLVQGFITTMATTLYSDKDDGR
jgi:hypothetical protein